MVVFPMTIVIIMKKADLNISTQIGIDYLFNCLKEDGSFIYEINAKTGVISNSYNILRHAGTLYVLYQWCSRNNENDKIAQLDATTAYLKRHIKPLKEVSNIKCIVEKDQAKLGGAALTLLALIENYKINPSAKELDVLRDIANFIVWMQESSGKFKSKIFYEKGNFSSFSSTYYPGEAILALIRFYEIDKNECWIKSAELGINYLVKHPVLNNDKSHGHNHWLAIALAEYYKINNDPIIYQELWLITNATLDSVKDAFLLTKENINLSSAAMATRGETLLAALSLELNLNGSRKVTELINEANNIIEYCLQFQIKESTVLNKLNIIGGIKKGKGKNKIRIDYVQHVLQILIIFSNIDTAIFSSLKIS
jgi:hypothetical protein